MDTTKRVGIKYLCTRLSALTLPSGMSNLLVLTVTKHNYTWERNAFIFQETVQDFKVVSLNLNLFFIKLCINNNKKISNHNQVRSAIPEATMPTQFFLKTTLLLPPLTIYPCLMVKKLNSLKILLHTHSK